MTIRVSSNLNLFKVVLIERSFWDSNSYLNQSSTDKHTSLLAQEIKSVIIQYYCSKDTTGQKSLIIHFQWHVYSDDLLV